MSHEKKRDPVVKSRKSYLLLMANQEELRGVHTTKEIPREYYFCE